MTSTPVDTEARIWNVDTDGYRWYSARAVPYPNASGVVTEWVGACTDIHERRLAEIQLRESEAGARLALDIAKLGTWSWSPDTDRIVADRRCREICGLPADGALSFTKVQHRIHTDDRGHVEASLRIAVEQGLPFAEEFRFVHEDESVRWVIGHGQPITRHDFDGAMAVVIGSVMDVTERRMAEEALRHADRQKDDFLALLAHELRNPLAPIRTSVQFLKLRGQVDEEGRRLYGVIERQVQHLVRMVDDLLDVSRVLRDKVELRPEVMDIADAIAVAVETSQPLIDAHRQELHVTLPALAASVLGDHVRLAQVVANLLNNASKYSPRGASIAIAVEPADGDVVIRVSDHGAGIPGDLLPRIFEPFVQADHSLERSQGGLGIGLTLVRKIVELHGGSVVARSAGSGQGSEFVIRLPAAFRPRRR